MRIFCLLVFLTLAGLGRGEAPGIFVLMEVDSGPLVLPGVVGLILSFAGVMMIGRGWAGRGWVFELLGGVVAASAGGMLGVMAQVLYRSGQEIPLFGNGYENPGWLGGVIGGVSGFLAGIWFAQYLRKECFTDYDNAGVIRTGVGLGMLCSTVVHLLLMIAYQNVTFWPMLIGLIFGTIGGMITGLVIAAAFLLGCKFGFIKDHEKAEGRV